MRSISPVSYTHLDIAASIKENNEKHGIEMGDIEGVGMGVPGPIKDDGTVLKLSLIHI